MIRIENKRTYRGASVYIGRPTLLVSLFEIGVHDYSRQVARKFGAGHSPLGALCNITLQQSCERGLFSHGHSPLGELCNVTRNPLYRVTTWDVATRHRNDTAPYKELSQKGILCI